MHYYNHDCQVNDCYHLSCDSHVTHLVLLLSDVAGVVSVAERATVVDHCKQRVAVVAAA